MKRSEMINTLTTVLEANLDNECVDEIAKRILTAVEVMGMLPPFSSKMAAKSDMLDAAGHEWENE